MKLAALAVVAFACVIFWASLASAVPTLSSSGRNCTTSTNTSQAFAVEVIHQFPNNTWAENVAVRSNGKWLAYAMTVSVYIV